MNLVIFFFLNFIHAPWRFFTSFFCISTTEHYVTWEKGDEKFQIEFDVKVERSVDTTAAYMPNDWLVYCILHFDTACLMEATISNHLLHFKWKQLNFWIAGTRKEGAQPFSRDHQPIRYEFMWMCVTLLNQIICITVQTLLQFHQHKPVYT